MSDNHTGLSHDLPEYVPNVAPEKPAPEETVKVALGDDYYQGAYFRTVDGFLDYEVPKSQLERWEAAAAAYGAMQDEVEQVMQEQMKRVRALLLERNPSRVHSWIEDVYGPVIMAQLAQTITPPKEPK